MNHQSSIGAGRGGAVLGAELLGALSSNLTLLDEIYARYLADPASVDATWRQLFEQDPGAAGAQVPAAPRPALGGQGPGEDAWLMHCVQALVTAYRHQGHQVATIDPLGLMKREPDPELDPSTYGLTDAHLSQVVPTVGLYGTWPGERAQLREILARLRQIYCGSIGVEFAHISNAAQRAWLAQRMESAENPYRSDAKTQAHIFDRLAAAEVLERFIHTKFMGTKRFSLEGGESLIPLLDLMLEQAGRHEVREVVLGMAHRGRLNVLANILGKGPSRIFAEFEDIDPESVLGGGDVKYHMGYSADHRTRDGDAIHLSLAFNPSHLEAVDPVVAGRVRAKQRRLGDTARTRVMGVLIHGDAAFAGQGLVPETLNLSSLHGYRTGGTLHIIVNNQIGFTTDPKDSRSTPYCSDVAKMIQVPIFHVNGDDPEAVAHVVQIAMEYRHIHKSDVVIDMLCYRKYGHNETDDPSFTQPLLYRQIASRPSTRELYQQTLVERGVLTAEQAAEITAQKHQQLDRDLTHARKQQERPQTEALKGVWEGFRGGPDRDVPEVGTAVERGVLSQLSERITSVPATFTPHNTIKRLLDSRAAMGRGERPLDWGMAEHLAFATLLQEGTLVRVSGQDSRRGTFSHRHAVLRDNRTGEDYTPLATVAAPGASGPMYEHGHFRIYDSSLSEAAVLGFEYGYSLDFPDGLIIWEAQFGDFVNGAQVLLDQFVSSAEDKWARCSGLVMLLPHGYEGQGPEHSSARFERFLQLCAEDNIQVSYPSTPAQYFHLLRRQVRRPLRKPLVVLTPKSLLRLPAAVSTLDDLSGGRFHPILPDPLAGSGDDAVERIFLCTGKVFYDLQEERKHRGDQKTALLRLELLYPFRAQELQEVMARYKHARELCWVQEEPANMGALQFIRGRIEPVLGKHLRFRAVSRPESASPATGSHKAHLIEQKGLLDEAFTGTVSVTRQKAKRATVPADAPAPSSVSQPITINQTSN